MARLNPEAVNAITQTVALIGAGLWGVYTFIYQQNIAPGLATPSVSLSSHIEKSGKVNDHIAIRLSLTRANHGQNDVRILGLTYNAIGIKENFLKEGEVNPDFSIKDPSSDRLRSSRFLGTPAREEVFFKEAVLFPGNQGEAAVALLAQNESVTRDIVFYADRSKYDRIRVKISILYQKDSEKERALRMTSAQNGEVVITATEPCRPDKICDPVEHSGYATELSLWD